MRSAASLSPDKSVLLVIHRIATEEDIQVSQMNSKRRRGATLEAMAGYMDKEQLRKLNLRSKLCIGYGRKYHAEMRVEKHLIGCGSIAKGEMDSQEEPVVDENSRRI